MTSRLLHSLGRCFACSSPEHRPPRIATFVCVLLLASSAEARADWLIIPFFGGTFATETTFLVDLDATAGVTKKFIVGGSGAWLTNGLIGIEADFAYVPGFFEREGALELVVGSSVSTLTGNVILTTPLALTRESLRPYLVGGLGLIHAGSDDVRGSFVVNENLLGLSIGGGAIGFLTSRTGVRFDIRHFRSVKGDSESTVGAGRARLSFWRATIGVVVRY